MRSLTPEQLAFLGRYGFDPALFARWRQAVREGRLSRAGNVVQGAIQAPPPGSIVALPAAASAEAQRLGQLGREAIRQGKLGVVILNGGMATRFGGIVKGVAEALPGRSFLGLKLADVRRAEQACGGRIAVFLMNSFATAAATEEHLRAQRWFGLAPEQVTGFTQLISVRMQPDGDVLLTDEGDISPYGPGHGDFAPALRMHGCLRRFLAGGGEHLLVGNVDNLGARVDAAILGHHLACGAEATVELAPKEKGDVGGAPYLVDGRVQLIEQLRYPAGFDPDIVEVFNTNTFHFAARALDREFDLGWYFVEKKMQGRNAVQVERLIGELTRFLRSSWLRVPRTGPQSRFFPIKTPEDLERGRAAIAAMYPA